MDFPFVKEALAQLFSKPSTIAFPAAPSPAKPNYRGRIVFHPDKCISCNMCERVCAGQAITHTSEPCEEGERITRQFYLGSCTFCSHCASFCTHGAIELSDDYHMVADYYHADTFEEGEEALIVRGTYIKKAPVKKAAPAAAPAAKPAAPKAEEKPAEPKVEEKTAVTADAKAETPAEVTEPAPKPKRTRKPKTETADAAAPAEATVTEKAAEAAPAPEAPKAEEKAASAEEAAVPAAPPEPRDDGKPVQDPSRCIYCTLCARNCPAGALTVDRKAKTWVLDEDLCVACGTCQGACPKDAIIM
jgi:NADH-quinone oxidoreductase subunit I